jgi:hypothetical protein
MDKRKWFKGTYIGDLPVGGPEVMVLEISGPPGYRQSATSSIVISIIGGSVVGAMTDKWWIQCQALDINEFQITADSWEMAQDKAVHLVKHILSEVLSKLGITDNEKRKLMANEAIRVLSITAFDLVHRIIDKLPEADMAECRVLLQEAQIKISEVTERAVVKQRVT